MKKILTVLICFVLLLALACPITAEDEQYFLSINYIDPYGNTVAAPMTFLFTDTINADNIPLDVFGYDAFEFVADASYSSDVTITQDGYLSISDVRADLQITVIYTLSEEYYAVSDTVVSVSYVDESGNVMCVADSSAVYTDIYGMMYVLPVVCEAYYPNGLAEVTVSQSYVETEIDTPVIDPVAQPSENEDTTVGEAEDTSEDALDNGASDAVSPAEDTSVLTQTEIITTYTAIIPAVIMPDIETAVYSYSISGFDINTVTAGGTFGVIYSEQDVLSPTSMIKAVKEYMADGCVYSLCTDFGEETLLSKIANFDESATNEVFFYYKLSTVGSLEITRYSEDDEYRIYTLELIDGDYCVRFALSGGDKVMFEDLPEGIYLITDIDAYRTLGSDASDTITVTSNGHTDYAVADVSFFSTTSSEWFTEQYTTTVTVNVGITE